MARLPIPGADDNTWGDILNQYLSVAHGNDGMLKPGTVSGSSIQNNSITATKLATTNTAAIGEVLGYNGTTLEWSAQAGVADATSTTKGIIQLDGDLAGTADTPTVPGLASKITGSGVDNVTVAAVAPSTPTIGDIWIDTSGT